MAKTLVRGKRRFAKDILFILVFAIFFIPLNQSIFTVTAEDRGNVFTISDEHVHVEYHADLNYFVITNKGNGRIYITEPLSSYRTVVVKQDDSSRMEITQEYGRESGGMTAVADISLTDGRIMGVINADGDSPLPRPIIFPGAIKGTEENQYFAIPYAEGIYVPATEKSDFGDFLMWTHKATMPFVGMTDSNSGIMLTSDTPADTAINFVKARDGSSQYYLMQLVHYPEKGFFGYSRIFYIDLVQGDGYNEMADIFRRHLALKQAAKAPEENDYIATLKRKAALNRNVRSLVGSVDFWLGPDDMKSRRVIDDLLLNGVTKALLNFQYGWKVYENEKKPEVIEYAADSGMLPSRYDNYSDIFDPEAAEISPRFRTEGFSQRVIKDSKGNPQAGYTTYYKGTRITGYRINPVYAAEDAKTYLAADLKENDYLGRFVDVAVSCPLYEDYSKNHPMTRRQDLAARQDLLKTISSNYGMITGTEETAFWAIPVTHYSEGTLSIVPPAGSGDNWSTPTNDPGSLYVKYTVNPTARIPLKSLVYHDCNVSGWYTGDSVSKVPAYWRTKDLLTILYGGMNLVFPENYASWNEDKEKYLWSIKVTEWVFEQVGYEQMQRHDFLTPDRLVQRTRFSNGIRIIANFSGETYHYGFFTVPPKEFLFITRWGVFTTRSIERKLALTASFN